MPIIQNIIQGIYTGGSAIQKAIGHLNQFNAANTAGAGITSRAASAHVRGSAALSSYSTSANNASRAQSNLNTQFRRGHLTFGELLRMMVTFGIGLQVIGLMTQPGKWLTSGIKQAKDFEYSMNLVNTILGVSKDNLAELSRAALLSSSILGVSQDEMTKGLYNIGQSMAGIDLQGVDKATASLILFKEAQRLALTANIEPAIAAEGLMRFMASMKLGLGSAREASALLFKTIDLGIISGKELVTNLGDITSSLTLYTQAMDDANKMKFAGELMPAWAVISLPKTASEAATAIKGMLQAIQKPSHEAIQIMDEFKRKFNVDLSLGGMIRQGPEQYFESLYNVIRKNGYLADYIAGKNTNLAGVTNDAVEETVLMAKVLTMLYPNIRASGGAYALMGDGLKTYRDMLSEVKNKIIDYDIATEGMENTTERSLQKATAAWHALENTLMKSTLPGLTRAMSYFSNSINQVLFRSDIATKSFEQQISMVLSSMYAHLYSWWESTGKAATGRFWNMVGNFFGDAFVAIFKKQDTENLFVKIGRESGNKFLAGFRESISKLSITDILSSSLTRFLLNWNLLGFKKAIFIEATIKGAPSIIEGVTGGPIGGANPTPEQKIENEKNIEKYSNWSENIGTVLTYLGGIVSAIGIYRGWRANRNPTIIPPTTGGLPPHMIPGGPPFGSGPTTGSSPITPGRPPMAPRGGVGPSSTAPTPKTGPVGNFKFPSFNFPGWPSFPNWRTTNPPTQGGPIPPIMKPVSISPISPKTGIGAVIQNLKNFIFPSIKPTVPNNPLWNNTTAIPKINIPTIPNTVTIPGVSNVGQIPVSIVPTIPTRSTIPPVWANIPTKPVVSKPNTPSIIEIRKLTTANEITTKAIERTAATNSYISKRIPFYLRESQIPIKKPIITPTIAETVIVPQGKVIQSMQTRLPGGKFGPAVNQTPLFTQTRLPSGRFGPKITTPTIAETTVIPTIPIKPKVPSWAEIRRIAKMPPVNKVSPPTIIPYVTVSPRGGTRIPVVSRTIIQPTPASIIQNINPTLPSHTVIPKISMTLQEAQVQLNTFADKALNRSLHDPDRGFPRSSMFYQGSIPRIGQNVPTVNSEISRGINVPIFPREIIKNVGVNTARWLQEPKDYGEIRPTTKPVKRAFEDYKAYSRADINFVQKRIPGITAAKNLPEQRTIIPSVETPSIEIPVGVSKSMPWTQRYVNALPTGVAKGLESVGKGTLGTLSAVASYSKNTLAYMKYSAPITAVAGAIDLASIALSDADANTKKYAYGRSVATTIGAAIGGAAGAVGMGLLGSVVPGAGTMAGGFAGGIAGGTAGAAGTAWLYDKIFAPPVPKSRVVDLTTAGNQLGELPRVTEDNRIPKLNDSIDRLIASIDRLNNGGISVPITKATSIQSPPNVVPIIIPSLTNSSIENNSLNNTENRNSNSYNGLERFKKDVEWEKFTSGLNNLIGKLNVAPYGNTYQYDESNNLMNSNLNTQNSLSNNLMNSEIATLRQIEFSRIERNNTVLKDNTESTFRQESNRTSLSSEQHNVSVETNNNTQPVALHITVNMPKLADKIEVAKEENIDWVVQKVADGFISGVRKAMKNNVIPSGQF